MRFRKKPVEIDAVRWTGTNHAQVWELFDGTSGGYIADREAERMGAVLGGLYIRTLEGTMYAEVGDWIIKGVAGECYPCKPAIFDASYDEVAP